MSAVAVGVNPANDRQYVFWRGGYGRIYEAWYTTGWHGPVNKGWTSPSAPSVAVTTNSHQYAFWQGINSHIYEAWYTNRWHGPLDLTTTLRWGTAGLTTSTPTVAVNPASGRQYVFWRGMTGRIYEAWYTTGWHGPTNMGWGSTSAPAVAVTDAAHQYVYWRGSDDHIFEAWFTGTWRGPRDLTAYNGWGEFGETISMVGAGVNPAGDDQYLFWQEADGRAYEAWHINGWTGPTNMGWSPAAAPGVGVTLAAHQYVFWQGGDGAIWEAWWRNGWNGPITPLQLSTGRGPTVQVVQTSSNLSQRLSRLSNLRFGGAPPAGLPTLSVNAGLRYQQITGVGAAMTDTSAWLIYDELDSATRAALMNDLFGRNGIHLGFTLVPMGASDFTQNGQPYSYDDMPPGQTDPQLTHFSIAHDRAYILPALRQMLAVNPATKVFATPWTAPPWMKANKAYDNLGHLGSLLPSAYQPLANYFVKFIQAYAAEGVPVSAIAPENEPNAASAFPAMDFPEPDEAQWIAQNLQPALQQANLHPKLYGADVGWGSATYPTALVSSPARNALSGIAWHCYSGIPNVMTTLHPQTPTGEQILTECSPGITPYPVPEVLIGSLRNWSTAVTLWNLALDPSGGPVQPPNSGCHGCTGVVTVNEATGQVTFNPAYYQLGQFGAFLQPGAIRISSNTLVSFYQHGPNYGVTSGLDDVAFLNPDGNRVLVAYNNSSAAIRFVVKWGRRAFAYSLPGRAMVTFRWHP
jgi:glucosylceramidase